MSTGSVLGLESEAALAAAWRRLRGSWQHSARCNRRLFLPGWGAPAALYEPGLPAAGRRSSRRASPPRAARSPRTAAGSATSCAIRGRSPLGGHSMGAALAILAAAESPELVERLVLVAPAGLPLEKPISASLADFAPPGRARDYPRAAQLAALAVARAPRARSRLRSRGCARARPAPRMRTRARRTASPSVVGCSATRSSRAATRRRSPTRSAPIPRARPPRRPHVDARRPRALRLGDRARLASAARTKTHRSPARAVPSGSTPIPHRSAHGCGRTPAPVACRT